VSSSASRWSAIAGIAWLVGFGQLFLIWAGTGLGPTLLIVAMAFYGVWALVLGVVLLKRPARTVLVLSLAFAVVSLVVNWSAIPMPSLGGPYWLAWLPDATAGVASLAAVLLGRTPQRHAPPGVSPAGAEARSERGGTPR
jgi:hypothetical protein